jgi:hypothetical protein
MANYTLSFKSGPFGDWLNESVRAKCFSMDEKRPAMGGTQLSLDPS